METLIMAFLISKRKTIIFALITIFIFTITSFNNFSVIITHKQSDDIYKSQSEAPFISEKVLRLEEQIKTGLGQIGEAEINDSFEMSYSIVNPISSNSPTGENIKIAVLDTGINLNPWIPSLAGSFSAIPQSNITDDDNGHGTIVAGIISKIAPDSEIFSIKVANQEGFSHIDWLTNGIYLAIDLNVSIIQISLGSPLATLPESIIDEINTKNITIVTSAGNFGPSGMSLTNPGTYEEIISVGMAFNSTHVAITSSNGPRPSGIVGPDLIAPGVNILGYNHNLEVTNNSGTSFAAPFVTGAIALLLEDHPNLSPSLLKASLMDSARFLDSFSPSFQVNGLLDITKTYNLVSSLTTQEGDLLTLAPKKISSSFSFFGHSINGVERNYAIRLFSDSKTDLVNYSAIQSYPRPTVANLPFHFELPSPLAISQGWNSLNLTIRIPSELRMDLREGNLTFFFSNNETVNLSISIANRYPGGDVVFYQGYDNDTFTPSGPSGEFSWLAKILENNYGLESVGLIRKNCGLIPSGLLHYSNSGTENIVEGDLEGRHILVIADIELGMRDEDIEIIQNWISQGHALVVLSYPSMMVNGWETLSNQSSINRLLSYYGIEIENDISGLTRFEKGTIVDSENIFDSAGLQFNYVGTSLKLGTNSNTHALATAIDDSSKNEHIVGAFWHDSETDGKVVVFGGMNPFSNEAIISNTGPSVNNLMTVTSIFSWLIRGQQIPLEVLLTAEPTMGSGTGIQIQVKENAFQLNYIMGTVIEANSSYTQLSFNRTNNIYFSSWTPVIYGEALLWLSISLPTYAPTNGLYIIEVYDPATPDYFLVFMLGGFVILGVTYYLIMSRQKRPVSPIEQKLAREFHKQKQQRIPKHAGLTTLQTCPRCNSKRYSEESKYCFQCGKEL